MCQKTGRKGKGVHLDGGAGGDSDHRGAVGSAFAGAGSGQGEGAADPVRE